MDTATLFSQKIIFIIFLVFQDVERPGMSYTSRSSDGKRKNLKDNECVITREKGVADQVQPCSDGIVFEIKFMLFYEQVGVTSDSCR